MKNKEIWLKSFPVCVCVRTPVYLYANVFMCAYERAILVFLKKVKKRIHQAKWNVIVRTLHENFKS